MFKNYFKIAVRNLLKSKLYSFINLSGLALGLACGMIILLYAQDELSYDRFYENANRTYRLLLESEGFGKHANTPPALAAAVKNDYAEVRHLTRVFRHWFSPLIAHEQKGFIEENFFFVDDDFFQVFSLPFIKGDRQALIAPGSVVITESMAQKYFGDQDPIGKTFTYNTKTEFKVTGVLRPSPHNMHFHPDFLASISSLPQVMWPTVLDSWTMNSLKTYVVLNEKASAAALQEKMADFYRRHRGENNRSTLYLQPVTDIHLRSQLPNEIEANSDIRYVYLLFAIALIILIIAGINYVNLATARSASRAKEVGLRKVVGAQRSHLVRQFLGESVLLSLAALLLAIVVIELFLPYINQFTGKKLALGFAGNNWSVFGFLSIALFIGLVAGSYPAFFLSGFQPAKVLKGKFDAGSVGGTLLRKGLVVVQFAASIALMIGTLVIFKQLDYFRSAKLGFNREQVIVVPVQDEAVSQQLQTMRNEFLRNTQVLAVGAANAYPGKGHASDDVRWEGAAANQFLAMAVNWIDYDLPATLGLELVTGRNFSREFETDANDAVLLNEAAVKAIGWNSPAAAIGKKVFAAGVDRPEGRRVIGVIRDFHFQSLHHHLEPLVLYPQLSNLAFLLIRIRPDDIAGTLAALQSQWTKISDRQPFIYSFLDEDFGKLYKSEQRWSQTMGYAAVVAILIAGLGLFGLASFMVERRKKEISVRKVLGASVFGVMGLLAKEFIKPVFLASVLASPVAYFAMNKWLQNFAYRIDLGWWMFALAGGLALIVALLTVSAQAIKTALANPVDSLRYE
jgi:putative ABC transport system permease protein